MEEALLQPSSSDVAQEALEKIEKELAKTLGTRLSSFTIGTPSPSVTPMGAKLLLDTETWLSKYTGKK